MRAISLRIKASGEYYVEAHHVMPVSKREVGSLSASNIVCLCANHHRQVHYGGVTVSIGEKSFAFVIDGVTIEIPRYNLALLQEKRRPQDRQHSGGTRDRVQSRDR